MKYNAQAAQIQREENLSAKADELRAALRARDPNLIALSSGAAYLELGPGRGELHLPFWESVLVISFPQLIAYKQTGESQSAFIQAFLLYHLLTANGTPPTGKWVSFADLSDGRMYNAAFQGYTGNEIVKRFGNSLEEFRRACLSLGGIPAEVGDASFTFQALPRVPLLVTYWLGDEDFPASCKILFDASASHYLPIDASAMLGSMLSQKIMKHSIF